MRAEAFPSLGQMSDGQNPKRAPSLRGPTPAMSSSLPDTQKGSQPGSAPKMGFANAVSGELYVCAISLLPAHVTASRITHATALAWLARPGLNCNAC